MYASERDQNCQLTADNRQLKACSSETFGQTKHGYQDESTPLAPVSPYAAAKAFSYWITSSARITHGLFAVNGILFNHESPRRGLTPDQSFQ
jgi:GDPmannose 4,6-dehydratase